MGTTPCLTPTPATSGPSSVPRPNSPRVRKITLHVGVLISLAISFVPKGEGGLGLASLVFGTPAAASPTADLYLDFDPNAKRLIATRRGQVFLVCEARNDVVRPGQLGRWGHCPPGWFRVGPPVNTGTSPKFGPHFLRLSDASRNGPMSRFRRDGIGIHGGGTGLPGAGTRPNQGWRSTLGCIRLQNADVRSLVFLVEWTRRGNGRVWIRVGANSRVRGNALHRASRE